MEERFVSMASIHIGALRVRLRPLDWAGRVEIRSGIDADIRNDLAVRDGGYDARALDKTSLSEDADTGGPSARIQTASPHAFISDACLPLHGWQEAYHGQIFRDETLFFPFLSRHVPEIVRSF